MLLRPLVYLSFVALMAGCSNEAAKPAAKPAAPAVPVAPTANQVPPPLGPLPVYQRELSGSVLGAPAGSTIEMAMMVIDDRGRPQKMLGNLTILATGAALPFHLRYNPDAFPQGARVEVRGRVIQSGQLLLRLQAVPISQPLTQDIGQLQFISAP